MIFNTIEYIILATLLIIQIWIATLLWQKIRHYINIFGEMPSIKPPKIFNTSSKGENSIYKGSSYECIEIPKENSNPTLKIVTTSINNYMTNNNGVGIDYHLIKDIVDRNVNILVNDIENRIPGPLYIGLAGTMLGIIMGLFKVDFDLGPSTSNGALSSIQPLIDGVKFAMSISVFGLFLTTLFSILIFKNATIKAEKAKNEFLSLVQTELLPKINNSQLPEIEILSNKLDNFSRIAIKVLDGIQYAISATSSTLSRESEILDKIYKLDVNTIAKSNIETLEKLKTMMGSINTFSSNFSELSDSLSSTNSIAVNLRKFVEDTSDVSKVLKTINQNVEDSNLMYEFFNKHLKSFEVYGNAVNEAVINADSRMAKAIGRISEMSSKEMNVISESITLYDQKLTKSFEVSIENFEKLITAQIQRTEEAFDRSRPKFEQLENLKYLKDISQNISVSNQKLSETLRKIDEEANQVSNKIKVEQSRLVKKGANNSEALIKEKKECKVSENSKTRTDGNQNKKIKRLTLKELFFFWKKISKK